MTELPSGWATASLADICEVNPRVDKSGFEPRTIVSFVPMSAIEAETGKINISEERAFSQVRQGYTPFVKSDILFAKITPCMENGKVAIVPDLLGDTGFGSTEFHVLRPRTGIEPRFVYHVVSNKTFRYHAEHNMTGAVGQKRVPSAVLEEHETGVPPQDEQRRIVEKIESMFDEIDNGCEELRTAKASLGLYRQSLLKSAFEGRLTAVWRSQNADKLEDPKTLPERIREIKKARYDLAFEDWRKIVSQWCTEGKPGTKPGKPKKFTDTAPLVEHESRAFPSIPKSWRLGRLGDFIFGIEGGKSFKCLEVEPRKDQVGIAKVSAVTWGEYDESESKTCLDESKINAASFINAGDFLLSRANTIDLVGAVVITKTVTKRIMLSDKTLRIHFASGVRHFFLHYLRSSFGRAEIEARSTGNQESMRNIGQDRIRSIVVPICSEAEQAEIVRLLDTHLETANALEAEIDAALLRADALRQSILKKAFSGQLVPQDPTDEPASVLLERIRAERAAAPKPTRKRKASA